MLRTASIRLNVTCAQAAALHALRTAYADACNRLVPIVLDPDDFMVLVAGDPLRTNAYVFAHNGYLGFPVARKIQLPKDWTQRISKLRG